MVADIVKLSGIPTVPATLAELTAGTGATGRVATVIVNVFAALVPALFVAVSCAEIVPAAVGVPEIMPVAVLSVRPPERPVAA